MLTSGVGEEEAKARQTVTAQAGSLKASVPQPWEEARWIDATRSSGLWPLRAGGKCFLPGLGGVRYTQTFGGGVGEGLTAIFPKLAVQFSVKLWSISILQR